MKNIGWKDLVFSAEWMFAGFMLTVACIYWYIGDSANTVWFLLGALVFFSLSAIDEFLFWKKVRKGS